MRLVHEGRADAAVSAGATGAVLAAGLLELRRLPGVLRPAIVQPLPSWKGPIVVLDIGATPDPRPNQLLQFAHMGTAFSASVLGVHEPRVGLLSNGHEEGKGNRLVIDSYKLLADDQRLRFAGNIEGRDVPLGAVDVVVTDGFTGNVVLKLLEGTGAWLFDEIRQAATSSWQGKLGGLLLRPKLRPLRDKVNPDTYGGSYLIGLRAIAVKAHGDSGSIAISNALQHAARGVREGLIEDIAARVHPEPRSPRSIPAEAPAAESLHAAEADSAETG
jgi:glycerol-3-phosphate acyltransferase PlsX